MGWWVWVGELVCVCCVLFAGEPLILLQCNVAMQCGNAISLWGESGSGAEGEGGHT